MKDTLIIGATHGDEAIGMRAIEKLTEDRDDFDWVIGNPKAYMAESRFTQADLNRSAPGNIRSNIYEERRAAELIEMSKLYESVIDIHGTSKDTGLFIIVTNPSTKNLQLARKINVQRIVIWPAITPDLEGPVSEFFTCGVEIECGPKNSIGAQENLDQVLNDYLDQKPVEVTQEIYEVYGELRTDPKVTLKEFTKVTVDNETFYPLLIGNYSSAYGVVCYKLRKRGEIS
jgi:succinylglutamate desuccinylase